MLRDLSSRIDPQVCLAPAVRAADATGAAVDLQGYGGAVVLLAVGTGGITFDSTNKVEFVMQHSDDGTTYTNVGTADVQASITVANGIVRSLTAAKAAADVTKVGYLGNKRYVNVTADFSGTHGTGTGISVTVIRGRPDMKPV